MKQQTYFSLENSVCRVQRQPGAWFAPAMVCSVAVTALVAGGCKSQRDLPVAAVSSGQTQGPPARASANLTHAACELRGFRDGEACGLDWLCRDTKGHSLVRINDCGPMVKLEPRSEVGAVKFPQVAPSGESFHLFEIPSARGGNAVETNEFYVVIVTGETAQVAPNMPWVAPPFNVVAENLSVTNGMATLRLTDPPSTTFAGSKLEVTKRNSTVIPLRKLPRNPISQTTISLRGTLSPGSHADNWGTNIETSSGRFHVDSAGACLLDTLSDKIVELHARRTQWDDGATELECLSVVVVNAR